MYHFICAAEASVDKSSSTILWVIGAVVVLGIVMFFVRKGKTKEIPTDENAKTRMRDDLIRQDASSITSDPMVERTLGDQGEPKVIQTDEIVEEKPNVETGDSEA